MSRISEFFRSREPVAVNFCGDCHTSLSHEQKNLLAGEYRGEELIAKINADAYGKVATERGSLYSRHVADQAQGLHFDLQNRLTCAGCGTRFV